MRPGRLIALLVLFSCACGSSEGGSSGSAAPAVTCPEGFTADGDGICEELAAKDCAKGTMPLLGHGDCQPVGWTDPCPAGMKADPSGWGCIDAVPATCPAGTRPDVAQAACVPVGNCDAPFPPADASLFVDANGPSDATHFTKIGDALKASKDGQTVAIESGTYAELLDIPVHAITIVGRCAPLVIVKSAGDPRAGVYVAASGGVTIRGVTLTGFPGGILLEQGELVMEDSIVDASQTVGAFLKEASKLTLRRSIVRGTTPGVSKEVGGGVVAYAGSTLVMEDVALTDNYFRNLISSNDGTTVTGTNVYIARNTAESAGEPEAGVSANEGGSIKLTRSVITDSFKLGVRAVDAGTKVELEQSIVRRATGTLKTNSGIAVIATDGATVSLTSSAVTDQGVVGIYTDTKATLNVTSSVVRGPAKGEKTEFGRGLQVVGGATASVKGTAFVDLPQSGIGLQAGGIGTFDHVYVTGSYGIPDKGGDYGGFGLLAEGDGTNATVTSSTIENNQLAGITSNTNATVTAEALLVRATKELARAGVGSGTQIAKSGTLTATRSAFVSNSGTTAIVTTGGVLRLVDGIVRDTSFSSDGSFGHGITVFQARVELDGEAVLGNAGVGLAAAGGQAVITRSMFAKNTVALHAQDGSSITESDVAPDDLGDGEVRVSSDTKFVGNGSRVGTGEIPLPTGLGQ